MVAKKGAGCCCSDCGEQIPNNVSGCCSCVCDSICVTAQCGMGTGTGTDCVGGTGTGTGTPDCDCVSERTRIPWDADRCAYVGTVLCGALSIDVKFEVKKCDDTGTGTGTEDDCLLCLTSTCLGLSGTCPDDCKAFAPGNTSGNCGKYIKGCDQSGGFNLTWEVDASGCSNAGCDDITLNVQCESRVNPAGGGTGKLCGDCDCVCDCVCITYEEECFSESKRVCWNADNNQWQTDFDLTIAGGCDEDVTQTITIVMQKGSGGCCEWKITATRGTVTGPVVVATDCPDVNLTWEIVISGTDSTIGTVTIACEGCGDCESIPCLCDDIALPLTLTATISNLAGCPGLEGETITLIWDGTDSWGGSKEICDADWIISLRCPAGAGGACTEFEINVDTNLSGGCNVGQTGNVDAGCSCDPITFCLTDVLVNLGLGCTCCDLPTGTPLPDPDHRIKITITE